MIERHKQMSYFYYRHLKLENKKCWNGWFGGLRQAPNVFVYEFFRISC